ncbi:Ppx/GppA family phosphatase [Ferrovibrio sp.]|uniref:Ppx/GppA family phosphatase n=1 Tax=Ferrovibrio sp. TaxID=1917215 RepID=UPI001B6D6303|nr:Ppx/GppA family phosphatase [Ferrovibrio sp.]MBP7064580.1 Ppx/GppA family phosphatase [Ferrovibrio sp.]
MTAIHFSPSALAARGKAAELLPLGVIDIGSTSVRLVVFDEPLRLPTPRFNEKVLCGLGRGLGETGKLDEAGVVLALATIRRFVTLARYMQVKQLQVVATAAARDASNGPDFIARIERETGVTVRLLSGTEEAQFSAFGVLSGIPEAEGVMGDLGGGSLELVAIDKRRVGDSVTLPLGPLRLGGIGGYNQLKSFIDARYAEVAWLKRWQGKPLYAVGGAWRAIARVHMAQTKSPLHIIHEYTMGRDEALDFTRLLARQGKESVSRMEGVPRRRQDALPVAALVMRRLLRVLQPSQVVFSAHGLREGLAYAMLDDATRALDPLLSYCAHMAAREGRYAEHGAELDRFIAPLFEKESIAEKRLRLAAAMLADIAWRVHPDYRGEQALGLILHAPFGGISQRERALLGLAVFARYAGTVSDPVAAPAWQMLETRQADYALVIGLGLRLGQTLSGGVPGLLRDCRLRFQSGNLVLELSQALAVLDGEQVQRRVETLAKALNRGWEVRVVKG